MAIGLVALVAGLGQSGCGLRDNRRIEMLEAKAVAHREKGEFTQAIAAYDSIIAMRPERATVFNSRGITYQLAGDYARAVADYDSALKLRPDLAMALKNRGRAHFYLGNFAQSARDLSGGLAGDTTNAFVAVWLHMVRQRLGTADTAELARNVARTDPSEWPAPVAALYLERITPEQFADSLAAGDPSDRTLKRCGGAFFLGEYLLGRKRIDEATARFEEAKAICRHDETEYMASVAELGRLGAAEKR
jgi:lipoprotein NlpI